jgi:hypothetical protein
MLALVASRTMLPSLSLLAAAVVLTQVWFPARFDELLALGDVVWLVLVRDLLLVALFAVLLVGLRERLVSDTATNHPQGRKRPDDA